MVIDIDNKKSQNSGYSTLTQKSILKGKIDNCLYGWDKYLDKNLLGEMIDYFIDNFSLKEESKEMCPRIDEILKPFDICRSWSLKVIIIADEPKTIGHNQYQIPFGQDPLQKELNPSLKMFQKSIDETCFEDKDYNTTGEIDRTLFDWLRQGILVINSSPTVLWGEPGSHADLWYPFISSFIEKVSSSIANVGYVLLGENAYRLEKHIRPDNGNFIIKDKIPEHYIKNNIDHKYMFFSAINNLMYSKFKEVIYWNERIDKTMSSRWGE